jgi:nucleoside-diphosphate-sugar epimerase
MSLHVLITGGAGYLGAVMCGRLLQEGFQVTVLDNMMYRSPSLLGYCGVPGFHFERGDARDEDTLKRLLVDVDVIIPLASIVGAPACDRDPALATATNLGAIQSLIRARSPSQLVVFPTTNSGYGAQSGEVHCTEQTPLEPISLYGRDKVAAELALLEAGNAITFRLATVFGVSPRMRLDLLVNHFVHAALTDGYIVLFEGHFKRNFIHIRDVADAFVHGIHNAQDMRDRPFNLGLDSANMSKEDLASKIQEHVPGFFFTSSEQNSDPDQRNYLVSNQRLREAGFEASRSIDVGIAELIAAHQMQPLSPMRNA